jgi:hypothetical protein
MRALVFFEEHPPIQRLARSQGDNFSAWLQKPGRQTTYKTAREECDFMKFIISRSHHLKFLPKTKLKKNI